MNLLRALYRRGPLLLRGLWAATPLPYLVSPGSPLRLALREWWDLAGYVFIDLTLICLVVALMGGAP